MGHSIVTTGILTPTSFAGLQVDKPKAQAPHINMLVYGRSSIGKTTLAGSADAVPEMRNVLYIDAEAGTLSLRKTHYDVDVIRITNWNELGDIYEALNAGSHNYQTVVLDSLTELQDMCMREIMRQMKLDPDNIERDPDVPGMYEWNKSEKQIKRLIRAYRDLPMNVIFTALMKEDKDPKTGTLMKLPDLPGKLAHRVAALFDIVLYYTIVPRRSDDDDETEIGQMRVVATQAGTNTVAKNRGSDDLPELLEIPDPKDKPAMAVIFPLIVGSTPTNVSSVSEKESEYV
jgi:phage nucleotide-binding protein